MKSRRELNHRLDRVLRQAHRSRPGPALDSRWAEAAMRMKQIREGFAAGLDVSVYAKPEFDGGQMLEIRRGLEAGIDVSTYAKPEFDADQMLQIRKDLEAVNKRQAGQVPKARRRVPAPGM